MEILVFGAGAMGSFFGGLLSVHEDVLLVGRKEHMDAIRAHGLRIMGKSARIARPRTATRVPRDAHPDFIVVSTKAYDTSAAMNQLRPFAKSCVFLTLQNGLDNPDVISRTAARVVAGTTAHGVTYLGPGEVRHAGVGDTIIGGWKGASRADVVRVRDVLEEAGIPTRISEDLRTDLWSKLIVNAAINPIAALAGVANGRLVRDESLRLLMEGVCREGVSVALAEGARVRAEELVRRTFLIARRTAANRASMLQDLDHHRRTEIEAITGAILRAAGAHDLAVPQNAALYALMRAREDAGRTAP